VSNKEVYFIINTNDQVQFRTDTAFPVNNYLPVGIYSLIYTSSGNDRCKIKHMKLHKAYYVSIEVIKNYQVTQAQSIDIIKLLYEN
jgi:hypothetical protein